MAFATGEQFIFGNGRRPDRSSASEESNCNGGNLHDDQMIVGKAKMARWTD
jgi:hypothetical protein